jgi:hypothetical protein
VRVATRRMANLLFAFRIGTGTSFCVASLIVAPHFTFCEVGVVRAQSLQTFSACGPFQPSTTL